MRRKTLIRWTLLVLMSALLFPGFLGSAWALTPLAQVGKSVKKKKKKRVVYEKEQVIRFDEELVEGKVVKPDGFFLLRKRPKRWQDLIKVRENFKRELGEMKYDL